MANFQRAMEWLRSGGKVKRKEWGHPLSMRNDFGREVNYTDNSYKLSMDDIEATDWEVYEEEKQKEELKTLKEIQFGCSMCQEEDLIPLKKEVIKHIKDAEHFIENPERDEPCYEAQLKDRINWIKYFFNITEEDLK